MKIGEMYKHRNSVFQIHSIGDATVLIKSFNNNIILETVLKSDLISDIEEGFFKVMSETEVKNFIDDKIDFYEEVIAQNFKNYSSIIETLTISKHK